MLGISIFFNKDISKDDNINYIKEAASLGYKRLWTGFPGHWDDKLNLDDFKEVLKISHNLGIMNCVDVYPDVFNRYDLTINDLTFFKDLNIDCLRIDMGFTGREEALLSYNKSDLIIELNASTPSLYIDNIMSHHPNINNTIACHNFYPQKYTGMSEEIYLQCNEKVKKYNLRNAAFVSSKAGKFPNNCGLPTLEDHRYLPIELQAKHLIAMGNIDDIIIGNCFASSDELKKLSEVNFNAINLSIDLELKDEFYKKAILEETLYRRMDASEYLIRSCEGRELYKDVNISPSNTKTKIGKGSVVIFNNLNIQYKGEIQIILKDIEDDGSRNIIGQIPEEELFLLSYIKPGMHFKFDEK